MKTIPMKKVLVLSLAVNAVLLSAAAYVATMDVIPEPQPPIVLIYKEEPPGESVPNWPPAAALTAPAPIAR